MYNKFKAGDRVRCIVGDSHLLVCDNIYTIAGYDVYGLVQLVEYNHINGYSWNNKRFQLVSHTPNEPTFLIIEWCDWCGDIEKRIKESLKNGDLQLDDFIYGPALSSDDPKPFCDKFAFDNIYQNYVMVKHALEPRCYWYISGSETALIYKPRLV